MKKILHISIGENYGGIENLELEYQKHIPGIDILAPNKKAFRNHLSHHIYDLDLPKFTRKNEILYDVRLYRFLKKHRYDIVHINSEIFFFSFRVILIARLCGVKKIVMHSHGYIKPNVLKRALISFLNPLYRKLITKHLACSRLAEESLYTKNFIRKNQVIILKNGIDVKKYQFQERIRKEYRKKLSLEDSFVYGHVGRFSSVKNHEFLIELFSKIQEKQKNAVLLLIGDGDLKEKMQEKVRELRIEDKVFFLGERNDVEHLFSSMDVFLFPSKHEGLGMVLIEAQTNGVPVFCSDKIPEEAKISDSFETFSLEEDFEELAVHIVNKTFSIDRRKAYQNAISHGYVIEDVCKRLEEIYKTM